MEVCFTKGDAEPILHEHAIVRIVHVKHDLIFLVQYQRQAKIRDEIYYFKDRTVVFPLYCAKLDEA